jgi:3D-(3,5/4)-trihydroxycyclohexane-1,2-dione acylhydrolase (decyclizing)
MNVEMRSREDDSGAGEETVRLTAAQAIVKFLQVQYSERDGKRRRVIPGVFAIFGHGNVLGLGQAIEECGDELGYYQPKNEQAMVHTAIGYAKAHDRLSTLACAASVGPGSTNMITGAATATVNRVPVLLLPADTFANRLQGPVMQALDHRTQADWSVNDAFRPVSAYFDRISRPEQLLTSLPQAMRALLDPADTGAVTIALHQDVQAEAYDFPRELFRERTWEVVRRPPATEEVARAEAAIRAARRPIVIAGGGVHYSSAEAELQSFAERHGIPVTETPAGKGAAGRSPLGLGGIGRTGTRAANALAAEADLVICVGTRLVDGTTGSNSLFQDPDVSFVGINVAPTDAFKLGAVSVVADARLSLEAIGEALGDWSTDSSWTARAASAWQEWSVDLAEDLAPREGERMSQPQLLAELNAATTNQDTLVIASGTPHGDVQKLWDAGEGARVFLEVGFSTMGHEIPAALGVRLARPEDPGEVIVVIGDGTYLMGASELATAAQEGLKMTVIVVENHGFQSIHALQRRKTGASWGLEFRQRDAEGLAGEYTPIDYAANAESFGAKTYEIEALGQLAPALEDARRQTTPCVIVARVEPLRQMLGSNCWWDVGVAETSQLPEMQSIAAEHQRGRLLQRFYG